MSEKTTIIPSTKHDHDIVEDFNNIMNGFQNNPIFTVEWKKKGDYFEKFSLYDETQVCITGIL